MSQYIRTEISNLKKPTCASKQDVLEHAILRHILKDKGSKISESTIQYLLHLKKNCQVGMKNSKKSQI